MVIFEPIPGSDYMQQLISAISMKDVDIARILYSDSNVEIHDLTGIGGSEIIKDIQKAKGLFRFEFTPELIDRELSKVRRGKINVAKGVFLDTSDADYQNTVRPDSLKTGLKGATSYIEFEDEGNYITLKSTKQGFIGTNGRGSISEREIGQLNGIEATTIGFDSIRGQSIDRLPLLTPVNQLEGPLQSEAARYNATHLFQMEHYSVITTPTLQIIDNLHGPSSAR